MKITFRKVSGEVRTINAKPAEEANNNDKGLFYFLDADQGDKLKCCKEENIINIKL